MERQRLESTLATVYALFQAEGMDEAASFVRAYPVRAEQTGHDNWNGGTEVWKLFFEVPAADYARLGLKKGQLEEQITTRIKSVLESETQDWYSAKIIPAREEKPDWRDGDTNIPRQVRANILDGLRLENIQWHGCVDQVEFLNRLYDLQKLPSYDNRFTEAAGDIWQHCINNDDWEPDWIYSDDRFNLIDGSAETFLHFLCEIVHPVVRPDRDESLKLVTHFNDQLRLAGWEVFEEERIAGRPRFSYRQLSHSGNRAMSRAKTVADSLDAGWMAKEIERLENAVDRDPALAIGTAKELVETCCKTILSKRGVPVTKSDDLVNLTKKLTKELKLVPDGITDEAKGADAIRLILRNLTQMTSNLARLRGLYGTGHGRDGRHRGLTTSTCKTRQSHQQSPSLIL